MGKQGLRQFCEFRAHAQGNPRAQLPPTLQCCLRAWDMLTPGNKTWKNLRLPWKDANPPVPRGQDPTFLRLPEGSEALRAGGGESQTHFRPMLQP